MDDRFKKFKNNELNAEELRRFRDDVEAMSDSSLDQALSDMETQCDFSSSEIETLRKSMEAEIGREMHRRRINRIVAWSAAVVVPVLVAVSVYSLVRIKDSHSYDAFLAKEIVIGTGSGERASTILPDGSTVRLGPQSSVRYTLGSFSDGKRRVDWSGDGRFVIARDENAPFRLMSECYEIKVLGTVFSIMSRDCGEVAEIYLEEGAIELKSVKTDEVTALKPGDTAALDNRTGKVDLYGRDDSYRRSSGDGVLYFTSRSLADVAVELERHYGVRFDVDASVAGIKFTGSLPADDLPQAVTVLEKTFSVEVIRLGGAMRVRPV